MFILAIIYTCIFIFSFIDLTKRSFSIVDENALKTINDIKRSLLKLGIMGLISAWLSYFLWEDSSLTNNILKIIRGFTPIISIISIVIIIILWIVSPTNKYVEMNNLDTKKQCELKNNLKNYSFNKSFRINDLVVGIDNTKKVFVIFNTHSCIIDAIISFDSIIECEIIQDNSTVIKSSTKQAMIGSIIAGISGAIIGAASKHSEDVVHYLGIRIITKNISHAYYKINIINNTLKRNSDEYRKKVSQTEDLYSTIIAIINNK